MYRSAVGAAALLSAAADPNRMAILNLLADGPACVCTLQQHVPVAANVLSYHLKVLREAGLVIGVRRGRWVDYALVEGAVERLRRALPTPGGQPSRASPAPARSQRSRGSPHTPVRLAPTGGNRRQATPRRNPHSTQTLAGRQKADPGDEQEHTQ